MNGVIIGGKDAWKVKRTRGEHGGDSLAPPPSPFDKKKLLRDGDESTQIVDILSRSSPRMIEKEEGGGRTGKTLLSNSFEMK